AFLDWCSLHSGATAPSPGIDSRLAGPEGRAARIAFAAPTARAGPMRQAVRMVLRSRWRVSGRSPPIRLRTLLRTRDANPAELWKSPPASLQRSCSVLELSCPACCLQRFLSNL